jgi:thiamine-phosphate pyrophosphorylase
MSDSLPRRRLARAALALASWSGVPPLVLMTDDERLRDPLAAARALPRGSIVVVRARAAGRRRELAFSLKTIVRAKRLILLIAGDAALARACGAKGVHLPETRLGEAASLRARGFPLVTASAHSFSALRRAKEADAVFLSPVFPTQSHPGRAALGAMRANLMARQSAVPVYALGGISARNAALLGAGAFDGIAAIGALTA